MNITKPVINEDGWLEVTVDGEVISHPVDYYGSEDEYVLSGSTKNLHPEVKAFMKAALRFRAYKYAELVNSGVNFIGGVK